MKKIDLETLEDRALRNLRASVTLLNAIETVKAFLPQGTAIRQVEQLGNSTTKLIAEASEAKLLPAATRAKRGPYKKRRSSLPSSHYQVPCPNGCGRMVDARGMHKHLPLCKTGRVSEKYKKKQLQAMKNGNGRR